MSKTQETQAWPDMAIGLYDKLTGRGAEISYDFDHFTVKVPSSTSPEVEYATWVLNGTLKIRTRNVVEDTPSVEA
jgi:hypothetical protein